jgi:hypothetical protein
MISAAGKHVNKKSINDKKRALVALPGTTAAITSSVNPLNIFTYAF